jgi:apolipoprotein N-acyltransferase
MKHHQEKINHPKHNAIKHFAAHNVFLAVLSGFLFFLSFPKYGTGLFAWIAFIPLFFALKSAVKVSQGLLLGFITGLVGYIGIIYWIAFVIVNYGYLPLYVGIALMLLLACYLSLYIAIFAGCIVYFRDKIPLYASAPVLWVCLEYGKSYILTGFPWENLGYSQYLNNYFIQFADVFGVFGLSFLIILVNATIFEVLSRKSRKEYVLAGLVFLIMASILFYGVYRVDQVSKRVRHAPGMEVSLVQGNIDQAIKWDKKYKKETLNIYERLSLKNSPGNGSLIIWPETAVPFKFQVMNDLHDQIVNLSLKTKSWLLFGSVSYLQQEGGKDFFNSAYLLSPSGEERGRYDKVHLVPYGEYVPLRKLMPFVEGFTEGIGDFGKGAGFYPLSLDDKKIGVLICYEGILPHAARAYKNNDTELLVTITNDAWFGSTSAPFQHFSMTVFRAIETRLYLVRAANTGISGIVNPTGQIIAATDIFKEDALKGYIKFVKIPTIYDKWGDILVLFCFCLMVLYFIVSLRWRSKKCR